MNLDGVNWGDWKYGSSQKPVPAISKASLAYTEAVKELAKLESQPVKADELAGILYRLQGHYWVSGMSDTMAKNVAQDYLRLLLPANYTILAVQEAYDIWLRSPENKFFPKIGELETVIKSCNEKLKFKTLKLRKLIEKAV